MPDDDGLRPRWRTLAPSLTERFLSSENWRKRFLQNENRLENIPKFLRTSRIRLSFETDDQGRVTRTGYLSSARIARADRHISGGRWHSIMPLP